MFILKSEQAAQAQSYINRAAAIALHSSCHRSRCGSIIVANGTIIGEGFNSPPQDIPLQICRKESLPKDFRSDSTCCIHAEQRAIMQALATHPHAIRGARLYFIRLDDNGEPKVSGKPYCTICSKAALEAGIAELVLVHQEGITVYDTHEYNELSFQYRD